MTEIHFLWTNLNYLRLPLEARTGENEVFVYNSHQLEALSELDRILSRMEGFILLDASKAKYKALYALYFPEKTSLYARNPFASPLKVFLALLCLNRTECKGRLASLWDFPPHLSKAQFSIRLAGSHRLNEQLGELEKAGLLEGDENWLE